MFVKWLLALCVSASLCLEAVDFVLYTQPKTGTHLLTPILAELTGKSPYCPRTFMKKHAKGQRDNPYTLVFEEGCHCPDHIANKIWEINAERGSFLHFHTPYTSRMEQFLEQNQTIAFFVKRDPRDQIVSLLNHFKKFGFLDINVEQLPSDEERLLYMIRNRMKPLILAYKGWLTSPVCVVLEFNKLMGSHGGNANDGDAIIELRKITQALKLNVSDDRLIEVYDMYFGTSNAFYSGKVGSWRDYFTPAHKKAAKEEVGMLLIELGFEDDLNW